MDPVHGRRGAEEAACHVTHPCGLERLASKAAHGRRASAHSGLACAHAARPQCVQRSSPSAAEVAAHCVLGATLLVQAQSCQRPRAQMGQSMPVPLHVASVAGLALARMGERQPPARLPRMPATRHTADHVACLPMPARTAQHQAALLAPIAA
jgi:hypothetical protein